MVRFLSMGIDVAAEMYFIRRLVFGEAGVTVDAVSAVFGLDTPYAFIEQGYACNDIAQQVLKLLAVFFLIVAMGIEPFAVVVSSQVFQKPEYYRYVHKHR